MFSKGTRYLLAALQAITGYEWFVSGANKFLSGRFPQGLADALGDGMRDNPNGWYVSFLRAVVIPHSVAFGLAVETVELTAGLAMLTGALLLCGPLPARGQRYFRFACGVLGAVALAGAACAFLCVNFHFLMGDGLISTINPANAFDEGIDLDTLLVPLVALISLMNARLLVAMIGDERIRAWALSLRAFASASLRRDAVRAKIAAARPAGEIPQA